MGKDGQVWKGHAWRTLAAVQAGVQGGTGVHKDGDWKAAASRRSLRVRRVAVHAPPLEGSLQHVLDVAFDDSLLSGSQNATDA